MCGNNITCLVLHHDSSGAPAPCPSYIGGPAPMSPAVPRLQINREDGTPLLEVWPDGRVEAANLESASEAGRVFVESIRASIAGAP